MEKFGHQLVIKCIVNTLKELSQIYEKLYQKVMNFFHESMKIFFANFPKSFSKFFLINDEFFKNSSQIHDPIETQVNLWIIIQ